MEKVKAKMISKTKGIEDEKSEILIYNGEELLLSTSSNRNFHFNSEDGKRIVRIEEKNEQIILKETFLNNKILINFSKKEFGHLTYSMNGLEASFLVKLKDYNLKKEELMLNYLIIDDAFHTLSESHIRILIGE